MITSGNRLLVLSLILAGLLSWGATPAAAQFDHGARFVVDDSTYVDIDADEAAEADNPVNVAVSPDPLGVGWVTPGDQVRLLVHVQSTHKAAPMVEAVDLTMLGMAKVAHALTVVPGTDETQAELAVLHPGVTPPYFPPSPNTGTGTFAGDPVPDTTLWVDIDYLETFYNGVGEVGADSAVYYAYYLWCKTAGPNAVFQVWKYYIQPGTPAVVCPDYTAGTAYSDSGVSFTINEGGIDFIVGDDFQIWCARYVANELYELAVPVTAQLNNAWQNKANFNVTFQCAGSDTDTVRVNCPKPIDTFTPQWGNVESSDVSFTWDADNAGMGTYLATKADEILNPDNPYIMGNNPDNLTGGIALETLYDDTKDNIGYVAFDFTPIANNATAYERVQATPTKVALDYETGAVAVLAADPGYDGTDEEANQLSSTVTLWDEGGSSIQKASLEILPAIDNVMPDASVDFTEDDIEIDEDMTIAGETDWLNPVSSGNPDPDEVWCLVDIEDMEDEADVVAGGLVLFNLEPRIDYTDASNLIGWTPATAAKANDFTTDQVPVMPGNKRTLATDDLGVDCLLIDNAGNPFMITSVTSTFPNIDNDVPNVNPLDIDITFVDKNGTGGTVATPTDEVTVAVMLDGSGPGGTVITDEESVVAEDDEAFGETFELADDGTGPDAGGANDDVYHGDCVLTETGIDGEVPFFLIVTDEAGNVSNTVTSTDVLDMDTEMPTLTESNILIVLRDDPATPNVDGDANGDGVAADDDWVRATFNYQLEGLTDVVEGEGSSLVEVDWETIDGTGAVLPMAQNTLVGVWTLDHQMGLDPDGISGNVGVALRVTDDAGNQTGWVTSTTSKIDIDQVPPDFESNDIGFDFATGGDANGDGVAAIGDMVGISLNVDAERVEVNTGPINGGGWVEMAATKAVFTLELEVTPEGTGTMGQTIEVKAYDTAGNEDTKASTATLDLDPDPPDMTVDNVAFFISNDAVGGLGNPGYDIVNVLDDVTFYYDGTTDGDIASVTADATPYDGVKGTITLATNFIGLGDDHFGWVLNVAETGLDLPAAAEGTGVLFTATDVNGNITTGIFYPEESGVGLPLVTPRTPDYAKVDTDPPNTPSAQPFYLTEDLDGNGLANVGDRMDIIVNMGDPDAPGYDMPWENTGLGPRVFADLTAYGLGASTELTDDEYSVGGEGDGQFSYVSNSTQGFIVDDDAGADAIDVAAGSDEAKVDVWARDNDGNVDQTKVQTAAPATETKVDVAVDTDLPTLNADDITVTLTDDADGNGVANIGDTVELSVDMAEAAAEDGISAVWALLGAWGDPTGDADELYVELTNGTKADVWTFTHVIQRTDNAILWDTGTGFSATVPVVAMDNAGNFSAYDDLDPVVPDYTASVVQSLLVDASAPAPVTNLAAEIIAEGRVKVTWTASTSPDVHHYMVFGDNGTGTIDYATPIGGPIDANTVEWVSDFLKGLKATFHFAVRTYDDGGNDDGDTFWVTGGTPDDTAPVATLESVPPGHALGDGGNYDINQPVLIHAEVDLETYPDTKECRFRARRKDIDPDTAGDQPSQFWDLGPSADNSIPFEFSTNLLVATGNDTYEIIARVYDDSGNFQTDEALVAKGVYEFTIDAERPEVQILSVDGNPSPAGMEVAGVVPVVIAAQDNFSTTLRLLIMVNGELVHEVLAWDSSTDYTYDLDLTNMPAGAFNLGVTVYDEAGWAPGDQSPSGTAVVIGMTVTDTVPPVASFVKPVAGERIPMVEDFEVLMQRGTASTDVGFAELEMGTGAKQTWQVVASTDNVADANYWFYWDTSGLVDGDTYWLRGKFYDTSWNWSYSEEIWVIVDGTVMAVDLSCDDIVTVCDLPKVSGSINLVATITGKAAVDILKVELFTKDSDLPDLYSNWTKQGTMTSSSGPDETLFRRTWNTAGLSESYDVRVIVTDTAENVTDDSDGDGNFDDHTFSTVKGTGLQVWIDSVAPSVDIARIADSANEFIDPSVGEGVVFVKPGEDITVEAFVSDACAPEEVQTVEYQLLYGGTHNIGMSSTAPYQVIFDPVADGIIPPHMPENNLLTFQIQPMVTDVLGNQTTGSAVTVYLLDITETRAFVDEPLAGMYVRGDVCVGAKIIDGYDYSEFTFEYSTDQSTWHLIKTWANPYATWETLHNVVPDGPAWLRVTVVDQRLNTFTSPAVQVTVDNTPPTAVTLTGIPAIIGRTPVMLSTTATDASGVMYVVWQTKWSTDPTGNWGTIATDDCAPFAYEWDAWGWYDCSGQVMIRALVHDKAVECIGDDEGNYTILEVETTMDFCPPFGCVAMINGTGEIHGDEYPEFPSGQMTFYASATDNPAEMPWDDCLDDQCCWADGAEIISSGVRAVQFQIYRNGWRDIGLPVTAVGPSGYYEIMWDNGEYSQGTSLRVRAVVIDNAGNMYEGSDCCPEVRFTIGDYTPPVVTLRAVDPITGVLVFTANKADASDIDEIEFRVRPIGKAESDWTIIGERTGYPDIWGWCEDVAWDTYDRWNFTNWPSGNYLLEARAFDYDHDPNNPLYDEYPPTLMVQVDASAERVTVLPSGAGDITSLEHMGIVAENTYSHCEVVTVEMTCDGCGVCEACCDAPVVVFIGHPYPCDQEGCDSPAIEVIGTAYNEVDGKWRLDGYHYLDYINIDYEGEVTIIGSWWDTSAPAVSDAVAEIDAQVSTLRIFRVTHEQGTSGPVTSSGVTVDIPPGNGVNWYGLRMAKVPQPPTPPDQQGRLTPAGDTYGICLIDEYPDLYNAATITIPFTCSPVKGSFQELGYTVARWDPESERWEFWDIWDVVPDEGNCRVTFKTSNLGYFCVIQRQGLNIAGCGPYFYSRGYTNPVPILKAYITDYTYEKTVENGVVPSSIKANLNGIDIHRDGTMAENWHYASELGFGSGQYYDPVSGLFAIAASYSNELLHPDSLHTLTISALNQVGDRATASCQFKIDRTKPVVDWTGGYVPPDFWVEFTITDTEAGVDPLSINLDFYSVRRDDGDTCCYDNDGNEIKEYRLTLTNDALEITEDTLGVMTVRACDIAMDIHDGEMLDVVLYSDRDCYECDDPYYDEWGNETDEVPYSYNRGVFDRVYDESTCGLGGTGQTNYTKPIWRRYMVDGTPPDAELLTSPSAAEIQIRLGDAGSLLDETSITITEDGEEVDPDKWTYENGILYYTPTKRGVEVVITVRDGVGNLRTFTFGTEGRVLEITEAENYPNPFDPEVDGVTDVYSHLSKSAYVTAKIYDFAGNYVATLTEEEMMSKVEGLSWAGTDDDGNPVSNGVYFCHIEANDGSKVTTADVKIVVLRGELE